MNTYITDASLQCTDQNLQKKKGRNEKTISNVLWIVTGKKNMKRKTKNIILKSITAIMGILFFVSIGATEITLLSSIFTLVSLAWILLFAIANKNLFE